MLLREKHYKDPRQVYKETPNILEWKDWVKKSTVTTPIMEIPDCDWGKDYHISKSFIEFLTKRNKTSSAEAHVLGIEEKYPVFGNKIQDRILDTVRIKKVQPTKKPKLIFVFNRLNGSSKKFNTFIGSNKLHSPYIQELKDAELIGVNGTFLHINPYDEIEYNYFGRDLSHLNRAVQKFHGGWEEYSKIDLEENPMLKYEARLYTNMLHVAYYQRNLLLNKFLNAKGQSDKPPIDVVYEYSHKNIYSLMCILQNYNLTGYEVKFYFPHLNEEQYKEWIVHNFVKNRRFNWPNAVGTYVRAYLNILLHTLMIKKTNKYNIELLLGTADSQIFHIPKDGCGSFNELQIDNRVKTILQIHCVIGDIHKITPVVNFQYDILKSPGENAKSTILETVEYSNVYISPKEAITDELYQDIFAEYQKVKTDDKNIKTIKTKEFIQQAIEKIKKENERKEGVENPKLVILYGPPASGKSKTQDKVLNELGEQKTIVIQKDEIVLNSDYYLAELLNRYEKLYQLLKPYKLNELFGSEFEDVANTIFSTYFLAIRNNIYLKFYNFIELYYYAVIEWAVSKKINIIIEVTGKKISNINELLDGHIGSILNGYKKEIRAIHQKFSEEYLSNIYRSFSEFRIINKEDLRNYANSAWNNLKTIKLERKYDNIDIYLSDNTTNFDKPVEIFERVNGIVKCKSNVTQKMIDVDELAFIDLIENIGCKVIRGADGPSSNYGILIALVIAVILFIVLKYFSNLWISAYSEDGFENPKSRNVITGDSFI